MPAPLIAPRWRAAALIAIVVSAAVVAWLSAISYHAGITAFDNWALHSAYHHLGRGAADALILLSEPVLTICLLVVIAVGAALRRRWGLAVLAVAGPLLAELVTELLLKPAVGRLMGPFVYHGGSLAGATSGAFPSGHETGVASAAVVLLIIGAQVTAGLVARLTVVVVLTAWTLLAALGLVRHFYHYATDTIGAVAVSIAVVLAVALAVDRWLAPVLERVDVRRRQLT